MSRKNRTSPPKIRPLVHPDMSGKYGTGPNLVNRGFDQLLIILLKFEWLTSYGFDPFHLNQCVWYYWLTGLNDLFNLFENATSEWDIIRTSWSGVNGSLEEASILSIGMVDYFNIKCWALVRPCIQGLRGVNLGGISWLNINPCQEIDVQCHKLNQKGNFVSKLPILVTAILLPHFQAHMVWNRMPTHISMRKSTVSMGAKH